MNKQTSRILFTDLDGTLLNSNKEISARNANAIEQALQKGHKIVITTGRPIFSAIRLSEELNLMKEGCYTVSFNGGLIYDNFQHKSIQEIPIPMKYVSLIFHEARKINLHCHTYTDEYVVAEKDTEAFALYKKQIKVTGMVVPDAISHLKKDPIKVCVSDLYNHQNLLDFQALITSLVKDELTSVFSSDVVLEFNLAKVSKGSAIAFLCNYLDIPLQNSVAVGDAENDISMIKAAHIGAVMTNGTSAVKQYADYITQNDNDHDGVAEVIEKFLY